MTHNTFPSFADYQSALQHPEMAFVNNFLRQGSVESDLWGFPRVRSGGFALTYKISLQENVWAARCFHRVVRDRSIRYAQICQALEEKKLPFFVPTRYMYRGIVVNGKYFPISILEWIDGESLEAYVLHNLENHTNLLQLSEKFRDICRNLEASDMSHGDLSHRNIIIKSDEVFLIDYDGMYVPALSGRKSSELGNIHFQHPFRSTTFFNNRMDRFSSIVIYIALLGLAEDPSLWNRFQSGGEGLLFQRSDFLDPRNSLLLQLLERIPLTARFIPRFRQICQSPVDVIPSLEELVGHHRFSLPVKQPLWDLLEKRKPEIPIIEASDTAAISRLQGEVVTVVGKVTEVFHGKTRQGEEHIFINFGDWQKDCLMGVLWGPVLEDMKKIDLSIDNWVGEWMRIGGLISIHNRRPQILVEAVTDCEVLDSAEKNRLLEKKKSKLALEFQPGLPSVKPTATSHQHKPDLKPPSDVNKRRNIKLTDLFENQTNPDIDAVLNQLYSPVRFKKRRKRRS